MSTFAKLSIVFLLLFVMSGCEKGQGRKIVNKEIQLEKNSRPKDGKIGESTQHEETPTGGNLAEIPKGNWAKGDLSVVDRPDSGQFFAKFETTKGDMYWRIDHSWAPNGAKRFQNLVLAKYYNGAPFYRVMPNFMVQFGMCADPKGSQFWDKNIDDDPVVQANIPGRVSYAKTSAPNSRSTQLFINYADNSANLDSQGFSPFAEVVSGMDVARKIESKYREMPNQGRMMEEGNEYVFKNFPDIDYIINVTLLRELPEGIKLDKEEVEVSEEVVAGVNYETVTFLSGDELEITADLYKTHEDMETPFIVLCHQAGWSRGEYLEIAPKLNELGFNCVAIDQRSGKAVNKIENATAAAAVNADKSTTFVDAEQDMIAALKWAKENHASGKVILWGSSYSAALALRIAGENPELIDGVLAFAPGEYFERSEKPDDWIAVSAKKITSPVFITSAKDEYKNWKPIYFAIPNGSKTKFVPQSKGNHGSRALWNEFKDSIDYWLSVKLFLGQFTGSEAE